MATKKTKAFAEQVYSSLMKVPAGRVITYQVLAKRVGSRAARAVGTVMRKNPNAPIVPCHRVVLSSGKIGQYAYGQQAKIRLLKSEGVKVEDGRVVDFEKVALRV